MCSPHPSYPPLEMSVFEVKTITNTYSNKDLSSFNSNMVSLDNTSPDNIAKHLAEVCKGYRTEVPHVIQNETNIRNEHVFDFIKDIKGILEEK